MRKKTRWIIVLLIITLSTQFTFIPTEVKAAQSDGIIGEIRLFAGNFVPTGWMPCNGQLLPISSNTALFSILGTTYGGNGASNFALPDLNGRVPIGEGAGNGLSQRYMGEIGGVETVQLLISEIPMHSHGNQLLSFNLQNSFSAVNAMTGIGSTSRPDGMKVLAQGLRNERVYSFGSTAQRVSMGAVSAEVNTNGTIVANSSVIGSDQPHNNMSPYLTMQYIICVQGIFPSRDGWGSATGFTGEIKMFAGNFGPSGWIPCNGQTLSISENVDLFNLIGTTYGGDGVNTFSLPDLRGRAPLGVGQGPGMSNNYQIGEIGGTESVTLTTAQIPAHHHTLGEQTQNLSVTGDMRVSTSYGTSALPEGNFLAVGSRNERIYATSGATATLSPSSVSMTMSLGDTQADLQSSLVGGSQPHDNMMPFNTIKYVINPLGITPALDSIGGNENYMGFIEMYAFNFAPRGRTLCNGQLLQINMNQALFSLLGTTYGGDGRVNFALPDLRGRFIIGPGDGHTIGERGGVEYLTLATTQLPSHLHSFSKSTTVTGSGIVMGTNTTGNKSSPVNALISKGFKNERLFSPVANQIMTGAIKASMNIKITPLDAEGTPLTGAVNLLSVGGSQPHNNMIPYLGITFAITTQGVFPSNY